MNEIKLKRHSVTNINGYDICICKGKEFWYAIREESPYFCFQENSVAKVESLAKEAIELYENYKLSA